MFISLLFDISLLCISILFVLLLILAGWGAQVATPLAISRYMWLSFPFPQVIVVWNVVGDKITETNLCWPAVMFKTEIKMATGDISVRNKKGLLQADAFWTQDTGTLSFLRSFGFNFVTHTIKLTTSLARTIYRGLVGRADLFHYWRDKWKGRFIR